MRRIVLASLLFAAVFTFTVPAHAQERQVFSEGTVRLMLNDGTAVVGVIESEDEEEIVLRTSSGVVMTIPREEVRSIVALDGERFFRIDPNRTRLFFGPTGRSVGGGAGYVAFYEIFVPFVAVGAGSAVTMAGGITINPGAARVAYVAPKVTLLERQTMSVAVGGIGAVALGEGDGETFGLLFGVGTFGPPRASISAGLGFGFADGRFGEKPAVMLGGEYQMSNMVKLLTENYVFVGVEDGVLVSGGVRFFGDHLAADIGLFTVATLLIEADGFPFIPWLGFAYNFGH